MAYTTTRGQLYLVELASPYERLEIQFVPEELDMVRKADITDFAVVGRNHPLHQYSGGDDKMNLKLDFYAEDERKELVIKKCRWLMSLAQNDAGRRPQPRVKLVWGELFKRSKWIVNSVGLKLSRFDHRYGFLPCQAYVDLSLSLDTNINIPQSDLRDRKYGT